MTVEYGLKTLLIWKHIRPISGGTHSYLCGHCGKHTEKCRKLKGVKKYFDSEIEKMLLI